MVTKPRQFREKRAPKPLDAAQLNQLALAYVARFATSAGKCRDYLRRKLQERGWAGEGDPPIAALIEKFVSAGFIDDAAFARASSGSLQRRGYGGRRIAQTLQAAGIGEADRAEAMPGQVEQRRAALALLRKRRFGPYGANLPDRPLREKQIAAMLRAGHRLDSARDLVNAPSEDAAELWAAEGDAE